MKDAVEDVSEEFVAKTEAMPFAQLRGHFGTNDDFPVREGKDVGGGGVAKMATVKSPALPRGDKDDAEFPGKTAQPDARQAPKGRCHLTT